MKNAINKSTAPKANKNNSSKTTKNSNEKSNDKSRCEKFQIEEEYEIGIHDKKNNK